MELPLRIRFLAALVAGLLAMGSSMSAARADEDHDEPLVAPSPATESGHHHQQQAPEMGRIMAGGNARRYSDGQHARYRMRVTQRLQPRGPYEADPQSSSMELVIRETVTAGERGPVVTLEVVEAEADGFLAETEERSALQRKVSFRPGSGVTRLVLQEGPDGKPDLLDPRTIKDFGDLGEIRMVDLALRAHLLNPVLPTDRYTDGQSFDDSASLPAGWTRGRQTMTGSVTVLGDEERDGRTVVLAKGTHVSTDTLLRVRAMNNAVEALQGKVEPEPNEFFAGTLFNALFPKGSTYESLMPPLPLQPATERRTAKVPPVRKRRRPKMVFLCLLAFVMVSCSDPRRNEDVVSLNLTGPIQMNHESVIDRATGVLLSSEITATARLSGNVYAIPDEMKALVPPELGNLSMAEIGMDARWTITEQLEGELPTAGTASVFAGPGSIAVAVLVASGVGAGLLLRRRRASAVDSAGANPSP